MVVNDRPERQAIQPAYARCIADIARKHAVFCAMALMVCAANSGLCSYLIETTAGNDKARRAARLV